MPGPSPTTCRAPVLRDSTGIPSSHLKSALLPEAPALDSLRPSSDRHSRCRCSHLCCTAEAVSPQLPYPRLACHPPCSRLSAYLLPSSWIPRGSPSAMHSWAASPLPTCRAIRRLLQWRCAPPSSHLARAPNATLEFVPCPSAFLPRVRAQSLLARLHPPSRWHLDPVSPSH